MYYVIMNSRMVQMCVPDHFMTEMDKRDAEDGIVVSQPRQVGLEICYFILSLSSLGYIPF